MPVVGPEQRARVLVVSADPDMSEALEVALRGHGYLVVIEPDPGSALQQVSAFCPDVALVDVRQQDGSDRRHVGRRLRSAGDLPLVFIAGPAGTDNVLAGFAAGADDYLAQPFSMAELLARLEALLRRAGFRSATVQRIGDMVIDGPAHEVRRRTEVVPLTPLEFQILGVFARLPGRVIPKRQLLAEVWEFDGYGDNLVEVHVSSLRRKLEAHGPRLIHTVRGVGYVLRP